MKLQESRETHSLWDAIVPDMSQCASIEELAALYTHRFYDYFRESTVLVRVFAALRFDRLPSRERELVETIAARAESTSELTGATDVLTLLGTRGARPEWNERTKSAGHLAIPLLSERFVSEIPMIVRVLGETGFVPQFARKSRSQYVTRETNGNDGLFFVGDARMTTDERGRLIIPAADFVSEHGVKTVFGFGGAYDAGHTFVTTIVFCREAVPRPTAAHLLELGRQFKRHSEAFLERDAVFAEPRAGSA